MRRYSWVQGIKFPHIRVDPIGTWDSRLDGLTYRPPGAASTAITMICSSLAGQTNTWRPSVILPP